MIPVVDVFAGPGGLNEGFSAVRSRDGNPVFDVVVSFEKDPTAIETLKLRAAVRILEDGSDYFLYRRLLAGRNTVEQLCQDPVIAAAYEEAARHVRQVELGEASRPAVREIIRKELKGRQDWVLIGGPPCQAYSLVGRSRRAHDSTFAEDEKHFLYREYLDIINHHRPAVFVMENVKGLLSASHSGRGMFDVIMNDLRVDESYEIRSLVVSGNELAPRDFVVRAEDFGIPQRRHRVILLGVRVDLAHRVVKPLERVEEVTVRDAIGDLESVLSGVSRSRNESKEWEAAYKRGTDLGRRYRASRGKAGDWQADRTASLARDELRAWYGSRDQPISLHQARCHMASDLERYAFLATTAEWGLFPRVNEFPQELLPNHKNLKMDNIPFLDRFKVQAWDRPSSTVASHISKDGHYYIHPDAEQMRSLTVREAARLQTFPDDYYFCGTRTMQFHQVGNAVPPLLAHKIGQKVAELLGRG